MTKLISILMLFALPVLAAEPAWNTVHRLSEEVRSTEEFILLQQKYPEAYKNVKPESVFNAEVVDFKYKYEGDHTCAPNDPRLFLQARVYRLCLKSKDPEKPSRCFQNGQRPPRFEDPCA